MPPRLKCTVVTENVEELRRFYTGVLQAEPSAEGEGYVEWSTEGAKLALFHHDQQDELASASVNMGERGRIMLDFEVDDVDAEYARFSGLGTNFVKELTTQPWGNRSFWLRDPDGNLINVFTHMPAR
jgi:catechol 2,3-dioxygenase-like lactoylglutathione lyase family enzyme